MVININGKDFLVGDNEWGFVISKENNSGENYEQFNMNKKMFDDSISFTSPISVKLIEDDGTEKYSKSFNKYNLSIISKGDSYQTTLRFTNE